MLTFIHICPHLQSCWLKSYLQRKLKKSSNFFSCIYQTVLACGTPTGALRVISKCPLVYRSGRTTENERTQPQLYCLAGIFGFVLCRYVPLMFRFIEYAMWRLTRGTLALIVMSTLCIRACARAGTTFHMCRGRGIVIVQMAQESMFVMILVKVIMTHHMLLLLSM